MLITDIENWKIQRTIKESLLLINKYNWLINSKVLDFYTDNNWDKLQNSWKSAFDCITPVYLSKLLCNSHINSVLPLQILSIQVLLKKLTIPRSLIDYIEVDDQEILLNNFTMCLNHPKLKNIFTKHVKSKKHYEILKISQISFKNAIQCNVNYIVDFGSGVGHLGRILGYNYGLNVCCLEQQLNLTSQAKEIDKKFELYASKYLSIEEIDNFRRPIHLNIQLTKDTTALQFKEFLIRAFRIKELHDFKFGIIGLHSCGDLSTILMNLFLMCPEAKFINIVGCCYTKLTCNNLNNSSLRNGYPLSDFLTKELDASLNYESMEIACHANEIYSRNLLIKKDYNHLKIHSYRAAVEKLIIKDWPELKHSGLKGIKNIENLTFSNYCDLAIENLNIKISETDKNSMENDLKNWKRVVIFYSLRLLFAPLIESLLLNDRLLFLLENGCSCELKAIFDPSISPRNIIINAIKST